jgi:hypothetical protein
VVLQTKTTNWRATEFAIWSTKPDFSLLCSCRALVMPHILWYSDTTFFGWSLDSAGKNRRLCSPANRPRLTHCTGCPPPAQSHFCSFSHEPMMESLVQLSWCVLSSTLDGDARMPSFGTHTHTHTHTHKEARFVLHPQFILEMGSFLPSEVLCRLVTPYNAFPPSPVFWPSLP